MALQNHWEWKNGWRRGRHKYVCYLTLEDQRDLRELIRDYQHAVAQMPTRELDLVPAPWLHVTMQPIAFADAITEDELDLVTEELRRRLADFCAPTVTFHQPTTVSEAVYLRAEPWEPLHELRLAMHEAVAARLPSEKYALGRPQSGSRPHVSLAYANRHAPDAPTKAALKAVNPEPVTVTFLKAHVVELHRDHQMWEWTRATPLPLRS